MLNVLIVDDSSVMRSMLAKILRLSGVPLGEVVEAGNGEDGLRAFDTQWIDLALVDIHMPIMDGGEMIGRLREKEETRDIPVIIITSECDRNRVDPLLQSGTTYVKKPFTPEMLREVIVKVTGVCHVPELG
jgi:two-component system chemotaxis response regulator CheY